mgnify:CR=1 FL=1
MGRPKKNIQPKSSRKSKPKQPITERERRALERTIARGIFEEAKRAEKFGPHPGFVSIKLKLTLYNAMNQREERLPYPKGLDLLVSSIEEVDQLMLLMERTIRMWIRGEVVP